MVSYICVVLYNLFYTVLTYIILLNPHNGPFLSRVMDEEIGSSTHPGSQSWSRGPREGIAGGG